MTVHLPLAGRMVGLLLLVLSAILLLVAGFSGIGWSGGAAGERPAFVALLGSAVLGGAIGGLLYLAGRRSQARFGQREAMLLVAAGWILGAGICAAPFRIWSNLRDDPAGSPHAFDSYVNCYFEAMSGLTTTGATVVTELATLPRSLLLWRATTHWLGGLGIVVLFVAVLPILGVGGRKLFRIEAGPDREGVRPRIQDAARALWMIYAGLTVVEVIALRLCGMGWFDSVCHTFATLATGGFSTLDSSIAGFASSAIHIVIIIFMFLAGVNFSLYSMLLQGRWRAVFRNTELRAYALVMLAGTLLVTADVLGSAMGRVGVDPGAYPVHLAIRDAVFQVVSIQTCTGFCSADSDQWGPVAKATLVALMFIGGCTGSTSGGIKIIRLVIVTKVLLAEIERAFRPAVVRPVSIGATPLTTGQRTSALSYVLGILVLFALGTASLLALEREQGIDVTTAGTAVLACMHNVGPGFARVGATQNYAWLSDAGKLLLSAMMVLGRLEVFAIVVLFSPTFWRSE